MSLVGESYLVGLIGSGITQTLSAPMHEGAADRHGLRYLYRPVDLDRIEDGEARAFDLLRAAVDLGFSAFNITYPCKQTVIPHLDEVSEDARRLDAVNTVLVENGRTVGHNTDWSGFAHALDEGLPGADLGTVVQLGTGGAGSAIAYALLTKGTKHLQLFDVSPERARDRVAKLAEQFPDARVTALEAEDLAEALAHASGLVNATPIGMHHHPGVPLDPGLLHPGLWVADAIYLPQDTQLIVAARERGCRVLPGGYMSVGQAVGAFELVTGIRPDPTAMRADFEKALAERARAEDDAHVGANLLPDAGGPAGTDPTGEGASA